MAAGIWLAVHESGVEPVIAGLAIGLVTAASPPARAGPERATRLARSLLRAADGGAGRQRPLVGDGGDLGERASPTASSHERSA